MSRKELNKAVAYFRTSSATNVGADKDSLKRQRDAVRAFARSAGYEIVEEFYDAAVSGADDINERPGFAAMLQRLLGNGVRTIIVETASRFARDLIVQETGWRYLRDADVTLIAADSPDSFLDENSNSRSYSPSPRRRRAIREAGPCREAAEGPRAQESRNWQVRRAEERRRVFARNGRAGEETGALPR